MADFLAIASSTYREWEQDVQIRAEPYANLAGVLGVDRLGLMSGRPVLGFDKK